MKDTRTIISLISKIRDKANSLILQELKKSNITGLVTSHGAILGSLYNSSEGKLRMNDIAEKIHKDKSTVTALVNKLEKLDYVQRINGKQDARITYISLTPKGMKLKPVFMNVSDVLLEAVYKGFNPKEKEELMEKLEKVHNNL